MRHKQGLILALLALSACTSTPTKPAGAPPASPGTTSPASTAGERPVPPEKNPPGDIPDNQQFVDYRSSAGFTMKVPEGWSRRDASSSVSFTDHLNAIAASWGARSTPPTEGRSRNQDVPRLQRSGPAFSLQSIKTADLPAGRTVLITYRANSEPNSVTGKKYRLDVLLFEFFRAGTEADLVLSSPVGADNVDPWNLVSRSFQWV